MEQTKFDGISRLLVSGTSRRAALAAMFAGALGIGTSALELDEVEAKNKHRKSQKRRRQSKKKQKSGNSPNGQKYEVCHCEGQGQAKHCKTLDVGSQNAVDQHVANHEADYPGKCKPDDACSGDCEGDKDCNSEEVTGCKCVKRAGATETDKGVCTTKEPPKECAGKCSEKELCPRLDGCECVFEDTVAGTSEERFGVCKTKEPPKVCAGKCSKKLLCPDLKDCECDRDPLDDYSEGQCITVCKAENPCTGQNCGQVKDNCGNWVECLCNNTDHECKEGICVERCKNVEPCTLYGTECCPGFECKEVDYKLVCVEKPV